MILCYFVCFHFSIISSGSKVTPISKTPISPKLKLNGLSFYRINYPIVLVILYFLDYPKVLKSLFPWYFNLYQEK